LLSGRGDVLFQVGEGRLFVDRFLDSEANALDERFRQALYSRTQGHPLFTVELLRAMQQRGDLVRDQAGRWTQSGRLAWATLPARAEAAIAERIDRLPEELREILVVASVEGEEFTAQAVALVQGLDELHALRAFGRQLGARHRLVREEGEVRVDGRSLSRYRFSHFLVQQHLYQGAGGCGAAAVAPPGGRGVGAALRRTAGGSRSGIGAPFRR
jgi:predicted ATPase